METHIKCPETRQLCASTHCGPSTCQARIVGMAPLKLVESVCAEHMDEALVVDTDAAMLALATRAETARKDALEDAAKECDSLGRMAPNQERGMAYDIAAKCIRDLKRG